MRAKFKLCLLAGLLIFPLISQASTQPVHCPGIPAINAVPLTKAELNMWHVWAAYNPLKSHYDTDEEWMFVMLAGNAKDATDAITKANANMSLITNIDGPRPDSGAWWCIYGDGKNDGVVSGYAVTGSDGINISKLMNR